MHIRKLAIIALASAFIGISIQSSEAAPPPPVIAAGAGAGAGAAVVGGILGFAAFAIAYDLYLKSIGVKSWDGVTPPKAKARSR
ncbi:hypothetical protein [Afipia carboxidovorans]|uniref:hypothetical protein n=1 Tax=Afipia carboxidovorans TaxID=40137 RepID=UPI003089C1A3|nr:hypothetical protein CRBSH125_34540 [Afipia carboxidovorans]